MSFGGEFSRRVVQSKMGSLKPDLISNLPGMEVMGGSGGHEFSGGVMGHKSFFSGFIESGQSFLKGRKEGHSQSGVRARFIAVE